MAYVLTFAITGCGGSSSGSATISGTITGASTSEAILLVNNGTDIISATNGNSFTFDTEIEPGAAYQVTLFTQPDGSVCTVQNGTGTVDQAGDNVSNISVNCQAAAIAMAYFNVGVTVSGLKAGNSVTFTNGADSVTADHNGLFIFSDYYYYGGAPEGQTPGAYNVAVSSNPNGQSCTLTNASGMIETSPTGNFVNVAATCK